MNSSTVVFSLDGNIGSGKSTLMERINEMNDPDVITVREPVDQWMNMKVNGSDKSIFEMYYENKERYAFMFQLYALQSRIMHLVSIIKANPGKIILTERCHLTDCEIFANMLLKDKIMTEMEYKVYSSWYNFIVKLVNPVIHGVIYLRALPETCAVRIIKRNRAGEDNINMQYLAKLHKYHESWLVTGEENKTQLPYPVLVVNGDSDISQDVVKSIVMFMKQNME